MVIDDVRPRTPTGAWPAKASVDEVVPVSADVFKDGHDVLAGRVRVLPSPVPTGPEVDSPAWPLVFLGNDRWQALVTIDRPGHHQFVIDAWVDRVATWRRDVQLKAGAGLDVATELEEGALLFERLASHLPPPRRALVSDAALALRRTDDPVERRLNAGLDDAVAAAAAGVPLPEDVVSALPVEVWVDRPKARFSAWYELFPRSEGGLQGATKRLAAVVEMGFDVVYLPPIHPIGRSARKGRDNVLVAAPGDVGSPWAIGSVEGGHTAVHPELGTLRDFEDFVTEANSLGMEVALDYALQCAPDHPWVREHPEWFHHRPDGSIKFAENPPKQYQDIYPINFWPPREEDRRALWDACRGILDHWIGAGVRIFRVDNPHTKPMAFWADLIPALQAEHPDVIFLAEAFTRPKVMAKLAEVGFSQSYTYFTWRTSKAELTEYVTELSQGPLADYMRPNFWPNTPDILAEPLRHGNPAAFRLRLLLAATLVPNYGLYSGYELFENIPQSEANEEYLNSEKYEVKSRDWERPDSLAPFITRVNQIRRAHPALQQLRGTRFHWSNKDSILVYSRATADLTDVILVVVNLDPGHWQEDTLYLDLDALGLDPAEPFEAADLLTGATYSWQGAAHYVRLDPPDQPGHVLHLRPVR